MEASLLSEKEGDWGKSCSTMGDINAHTMHRGGYSKEFLPGGGKKDLAREARRFHPIPGSL